MHVSPHWACLAALPAGSTQWGHSDPLPTGSAAPGSPARSQPAAGHRPGPCLLPLPLGAATGLCVTPTLSLPDSDQTTAVLGPHRGLSSPKGTALGQLGTGLSPWPSVNPAALLRLCPKRTIIFLQGALLVSGHASGPEPQTILLHSWTMTLPHHSLRPLAPCAPSCPPHPAGLRAGGAGRRGQKPQGHGVPQSTTSRTLPASTLPTCGRTGPCAGHCPEGPGVTPLFPVLQKTGLPHPGSELCCDWPSRGSNMKPEAKNTLPLLCYSWWVRDLWPKGCQDPLCGLGWGHTPMDVASLSKRS